MSASSQRALEEEQADQRLRDAAPALRDALRVIHGMTFDSNVRAFVENILANTTGERP